MPFLDLKKQFGHLYKPGAKVPVLVDVPPLRFLMADGEGPVGADSPGFQDVVGALYSLAYATKFEAKKRLDLAYAVMPLEGLYWDAEGDATTTTPQSVDQLTWRLMIMLPDQVPGELVEEVRERVAVKKPSPRLADVRVQTFSEGQSVQIMHIGPYSEEPATIKRLLAFASERGYEVSGAHHEIYFGDPKKSAPEKLKTVLRYPVKRRK